MTNSDPIRVRFAPSPTGYLHVGGARTALFNYLFTRHLNGQFLLRIEDTDQARSEERLVQSIMDSLEWLGLHWDEPPVYQSSRQARYQEICQSLLESKYAYRCFCMREEMEQQSGADRVKRIDRQSNCTCKVLPDKEVQNKVQNNRPFALRFCVPDGKTVFDDLVHGVVAVSNTEIDDFVIQRSDGSPVYQIAVVVDDHDMNITHVIRGDDHLTNTPKQILLYKALDWDLPQFGHVPLILGPDQKRLSKRHGATSVEAYRDQGILPETMVNFLALLGWSPGNDLEIMDLETMVQKFSIDRISKKPAVFDFKKLEWMNSHYLSTLSNTDLLKKLHPGLIKMGWLPESMNSEMQTFLYKIIDLLKPRMKFLNDFFDQAAYFFNDLISYDENAVQKHWKGSEIAERLKAVYHDLQACEPWNEITLEGVIRRRAESMDIGAGKLIHPIRLAITGSGASPGLFEVMVLLGKIRVIKRINTAIQLLNAQISHP